MLLLLACAEVPADSAADPESATLPDQLSEYGFPVGVQTVEVEGLLTEVWYPASDSVADAAEAVADFNDFVPASVAEVLGTVDFPDLPLHAVRDAPLRDIGADYPAIVFSHGFGGVRLQSTDHAAHLASRGYVVLATDHASRSFTSLLPCLFSPALEGCDLSGFGSDEAAVEEVGLLLDWMAEHAEEWRVDPTRVGLSGHSAGGGTVISASSDERVDATLVMAAPGAPSETPTLLMGGSCDAFADRSAMEAVGAPLVEVEEAGHLAFSDLCTLDLIGLADDVLAPRDDVNALLLDQLYALASDGCPGVTPPSECGLEAYLALEVSAPIVRHYGAAFFDGELGGKGPGVEAGLYLEATVTE